MEIANQVRKQSRRTCMDKDQRRNLPKKKEKQKQPKLPRLEKLLSPILLDCGTHRRVYPRWDTGEGKRLRPPIKVNVNSGNGELLISYRLDADPQNLLKPHRLYGDESKWHTASTFPVTAVVTDRNGNGFEVTIASSESQKAN